MRGAVDAEIKVPSVENTEPKGFPFKAWSRSVDIYTCYSYCQGFLPCWFLPFQSIHLHFFQNLSLVFTVLAVANNGSCLGPQNEIGHPAHRYRQLMQVPMLSIWGIIIGSKTDVTVFLASSCEILSILLVVLWEKETCGIMPCGMNN